MSLKATLEKCVIVIQLRLYVYKGIRHESFLGIFLSSFFLWPFIYYTLVSFWIVLLCSSGLIQFSCFNSWVMFISINLLTDTGTLLIMSKAYVLLPQKCSTYLEHTLIWGDKWKQYTLIIFPLSMQLKWTGKCEPCLVRISDCLVWNGAA